MTSCILRHSSFTTRRLLIQRLLILNNCCCLEYRFLNVFCECSNKAFLESLIGDVNVVCFQRASFCWEGISLYLSYFFFHLCKLKKRSAYKINSFYITLNCTFKIIFFKYFKYFKYSSETVRLMFLSNCLSFIKGIKQDSFCFMFLRRSILPICIWLC